METLDTWATMLFDWLQPPLINFKNSGIVFQIFNRLTVARLYSLTFYTSTLAFLFSLTLRFFFFLSGFSSAYALLSHERHFPFSCLDGFCLDFFSTLVELMLKPTPSPTRSFCSLLNSPSIRALDHASHIDTTKGATNLRQMRGMNSSSRCKESKALLPIWTRTIAFW